MTFPQYSDLAFFFSQLKSLLDEGVIQPYDFTGAVILAYLAHRRPKNWVNGKMKPCVVVNEEECKMNEQSCKLSTMPELCELLDSVYVCKKLGLPADRFNEVRICTLFNCLRFASIKQNADNYINHSIVRWAMGERPFKLLMYIPTPMEVLRMQAVGERVVTVFVTAEELDSQHVAQLHYMDGNELAVRDSFEFLAHDLKHMEHFAGDPDKYLEQVGFFHAFLHLPIEYMNKEMKEEGSVSSSISISPSVSTAAALSADPPVSSTLSLKKVFTSVVFPGDIRLWHELEYVISDMNCYLPHLLKYLLAKLLEASKRQLISSDCVSVSGDGGPELESFHKKWSTVLGYLVPDCAQNEPRLFAVLEGMSTRILHPQIQFSATVTHVSSGGAKASESESIYSAVPPTTACTPTQDAAVGASYTDCANLFSVEDGELVRTYFQTLGKQARMKHIQATLRT